jgi:hypothetical protein
VDYSNYFLNEFLFEELSKRRCLEQLFRRCLEQLFRRGSLNGAVFNSCLGGAVWTEMYRTVVVVNEGLSGLRSLNQLS